MGKPKTSSDAGKSQFYRASDAPIAAHEKFFKENKERHLEEVADLVAFPSLRMNPTHHPDVQKAAELLRAKLVGAESKMGHG